MTVETANQSSADGGNLLPADPFRRLSREEIEAAADVYPNFINDLARSVTPEELMLWQRSGISPQRYDVMHSTWTAIHDVVTSTYDSVTVKANNMAPDGNPDHTQHCPNFSSRILKANNMGDKPHYLLAGVVEFLPIPLYVPTGAPNEDATPNTMGIISIVDGVRTQGEWEIAAKVAEAEQRGDYTPYATYDRYGNPTPINNVKGIAVAVDQQETGLRHMFADEAPAGGIDYSKVPVYALKSTMGSTAGREGIRSTKDEATGKAIWEMLSDAKIQQNQIEALLQMFGNEANLRRAVGDALYGWSALNKMMEGLPEEKLGDTQNQLPDDYFDYDKIESAAFQRTNEYGRRFLERWRAVANNGDGSYLRNSLYQRELAEQYTNLQLLRESRPSMSANGHNQLERTLRRLENEAIEQFANVAQQSRQNMILTAVRGDREMALDEVCCYFESFSPTMYQMVLQLGSITAGPHADEAVDMVEVYGAKRFRNAELIVGPREGSMGSVQRTEGWQDIPGETPNFDLGTSEFRQTAHLPVSNTGYANQDGAFPGEKIADMNRLDSDFPGSGVFVGRYVVKPQNPELLDEAKVVRIVDFVHGDAAGIINIDQMGAISGTNPGLPGNVEIGEVFSRAPRDRRYHILKTQNGTTKYLGSVAAGQSVKIVRSPDNTRVDLIPTTVIDLKQQYKNQALKAAQAKAEADYQRDSAAWEQLSRRDKRRRGNQKPVKRVVDEYNAIYDADQLAERAHRYESVTPPVMRGSTIFAGVTVLAHLGVGQPIVHIDHAAAANEYPPTVMPSENRAWQRKWFQDGTPYDGSVSTRGI